MRTEDFDYHLPPELVAQTPIEPRDASRLLVVDRDLHSISHDTFTQLPQFLRPGDLLVVNDSRVLPARLRGTRSRGGGTAELLLLRDFGEGRWLCLARPARRMRIGDTLSFGDGLLRARIVEELPDGQRVVAFETNGRPFLSVLAELGEMPLPPYIHQQPSDRERYQTVYAREVGSVAAPTAGLHFTHDLLSRLSDQGVRLASVTLHVGLGTFKTVQVDDIEQHRMHAEFGMLSAETASLIAETRNRGNRIIAVGTTALRVLETAAIGGTVAAWSGWTDIFIYPGFTFRATDALVTNFHLPRSTLLMLISAFAGKDLVDRAYALAVAERYRFFSFGDAMLII
ncbi:MAG: queA [Chloroflexi bacterium]|nr:queA [Chloroflexota bacterium]